VPSSRSEEDSHQLNGVSVGALYLHIKFMSWA